MVPARRRTAGAPISYREDDFEDDDSQDDESFADSGEDSENELHAHLKRKRTKEHQTPRLRTRTRIQPRQTYKESSDEHSEDDYADGNDRKDGQGVASSSQRAPQSESRNARLLRKEKTPAHTQKRRRERVTASSWRRSAPSAPPRPGKARGPTDQDLWFMGKPCAWMTLPPLILREIISYAVHPLLDEHGGVTSNLKWLCALRKVHPALLEPSIDVLYVEPPLHSSVAVHRLLSTLVPSSISRTYNYNVKIRTVQLEDRRCLAYSAGPELGAVDPAVFVQQLPQLRTLDIWSLQDHPSPHRLDREYRPWSYPDSLFATLSTGPQRLRSFHWNSRFLSKQITAPLAMYEWMRSIHESAAFQSLRHLKVTGFLGDSAVRTDLQFPIGFETPNQSLTTGQQRKEVIRLERKAAQEHQDTLFAKVLSTLPNLTMLDLRLCSIVDGDWLRLLPESLTHLSIIECDRLYSDSLQEFLHSHGARIKTLVLKHNPALNLSFLTSLRRDCSLLEELNMDLTQFGKLQVPTENEGPLDEQLLLVDERPEWPASLQSLRMGHLHRWSAAAADTFFNSLVESAVYLTALRQLEITASLDVSWRERAKLRDYWEDKFQRVFLRKSAPPNPAWWSIRNYYDDKARAQEKRRVSIIIPITPTPEVTTASPTEVDSEAPRRRLRPRKVANEEDSTIEASKPGSSLRDMVMQSLEKHIHGLCDIVNVRIDNMRPSEHQVTEEDFLDRERSGDEDWNEERGDLNDEELYVPKSKRGTYAW